MKEKATLLRAGLPVSIVQEVRTRAGTVTACPVCKIEFKKNDKVFLVDLVLHVPLTTRGAPGHHEFAERVRICEQCIAPMIRQRSEALRQFFRMLLTKEFIENATKEVRQIETAKRSRKRVPKSTPKNPEQ